MRVTILIMAALCFSQYVYTAPLLEKKATDFPGIVVKVGSKYVQLAVAGMSSFRVGVSSSSTLTTQIPSSMVANQTSNAPFNVVQPTSTSTGITTSFGSIAIDTTTAVFTMKDLNGVVLTQSVLFPVSDDHVGRMPRLEKNDTCLNAQNGVDAVNPGNSPTYPQGISGATQASCCATCDSDAKCIAWVYSDGSAPDPSGKNCWPLASLSGVTPRYGRTMGGSIPPPPPLPISLTLARSQSALFYGAGGSSGSVLTLTQTSSNAYVQNTAFMTSHYWTTDGYAALGVSPILYTPGQENQYPVSWSATSGNSVEWTFAGNQVDLYLMPAATMKLGMTTYWQLSGAPAVLPRYAYGFMASRWGWVNASYIESILDQFRSGKYPLDAWISDFEWYTPEPDYNLPNSGSPTFQDFTYNNITFPQPVPQLKHYHQDLNLRFGGIRKPRLGNTELLNMARANGWLLDGGRNLNYSIPAVKAFYATNIAHFYPDGVDFWWNDEGETQYYTFFDWNDAEADALTAFDSTKRMFTINRAYTPGMQRQGAITWTGDIQVSWQYMAMTPGYMLNWELAGTGHVTCDIGGFNGPNDPPDLLARWYQLGVFLSVMRVHSTDSDLPHFPFLYPEPDASTMRDALNLRYALIPYHYSLAHVAYSLGLPIMRPLIMEYPTDPNVASTTNQWLDGDRLLTAPMLTSADGQNTDTSRSVYLPGNSTWVECHWSGSVLSAAAVHQAPTSFTLNNYVLDEIVFFLGAGAVVPIVGSFIQYSDALPGGPLNVLIAPGSDGSFTHVEDDGETFAYTNAAGLRQTTYTWNDSTSTLSWSVVGTFSDVHVFTSVQATVFHPSGTKVCGPTTIGNSGTVVC